MLLLSSDFLKLVTRLEEEGFSDAYSIESALRNVGAIQGFDYRVMCKSVPYPKDDVPPFVDREVVVIHSSGAVSNPFTCTGRYMAIVDKNFPAFLRALEEIKVLRTFYGDAKNEQRNDT